MQLAALFSVYSPARENCEIVEMNSNSTLKIVKKKKRKKRMMSRYFPFQHSYRDCDIDEKNSNSTLKNVGIKAEFDE